MKELTGQPVQEFPKPEFEGAKLHSAWMELSRPNLDSNWTSIQKVVGEITTVIPMLKADSYGHGAVEIARMLETKGLKMAGVSSLKEAVELRSNGIKAPILITDYISPEDLKIALDSWTNASLVISDPQMLEPIENAAHQLNKTAKVHLFIDSGMHREGVFPELAMPLIRKINKSPFINFEGIMTHFAQPTDPDPEPTFKQLEVFNGILDKLEEENIPLPPLVHAAEGASIMRFPQTYTGRFTAVRPGNILYGIAPGGKDFEQYLQFVPKPVLKSIKAKLENVKFLQAGSLVGYSRAILDKNTTIGTIDVGHADGFRPSQSKETIYLLVGGQKVPVLDKEAMTKLILALPDSGNYSVGDEVVIIGKQGNREITLAEITRKTMGTSNLTRFTTQLNSFRLPRIWTNE